jgi:hypothetical protein
MSKGAGAGAGAGYGYGDGAGDGCQEFQKLKTVLLRP